MYQASNDKMAEYPATKGYLIEAEQRRLKDRIKTRKHEMDDGGRRLINLRAELSDAYKNDDKEKIRRILGRINYIIIRSGPKDLTITSY